MLGEYRVCDRCGWRRMRLVAKSWKTLRRPDAPDEYLYKCPNCEQSWIYTPGIVMTPTNMPEAVQDETVRYY
jgi:DNA-directed RNA polymerase subunit RPC12/RpoP